MNNIHTKSCTRSAPSTGTPTIQLTENHLRIGYQLREASRIRMIGTCWPPGMMQGTNTKLLNSFLDEDYLSFVQNAFSLHNNSF